jgi:hypothetical protein
VAIICFPQFQEYFGPKQHLARCWNSFDSTCLVCTRHTQWPASRTQMFWVEMNPSLRMYLRYIFTLAFVLNAQLASELWRSHWSSRWLQARVCKLKGWKELYALQSIWQVLGKSLLLVTIEVLCMFAFAMSLTCKNCFVGLVIWIYLFPSLGLQASLRHVLPRLIFRRDDHKASLMVLDLESTNTQTVTLERGLVHFSGTTLAQ